MITPPYDQELLGATGIGHQPAPTDPTVTSEVLDLRRFRPRSQLRVPATARTRSSVRAVDAHAHLGRWLTGGRWAVPDVGRFVAMLDEVNVEAVVNLDGMWEAELAANLERYDHAYPGRFITCCQVDWSALAGPDPERALVDQLRRSVDDGARGLKVWKSLGLSVRDATGRLVRPDDERIDGLWRTAGDLGLPVFLHTGDPAAFFDPVDERNERLEELVAHPEWSFADGRFPGFEDLRDSFLRAVARHPGTRFVGVHVAGSAEDLGWVDRALTDHANLTIDIASRIAELGRQPRATRALLDRHPTRVLFGTDGIAPTAELYATHFRFLETADEHFPYSSIDPPPTGRWRISGLDLPRAHLDGLYRDNLAGLPGF